MKYSKKRSFKKRYGKKKFIKKCKERTMTIPKSVVQVGDRVMTKCVYFDTSRSVINNAGIGYANIIYNPNYAYDIDPTVGSTNTVGFSEWGAFFNLYRVHAYKITVDFANLDGLPVNCFIYQSNTAITANTNFSTSGYWLANNWVKYKQISANGGMDRCVLSHYVPMRRIVGSKAVDYADSYIGAVNGGSPTDKIYTAVGGFINGGTFTNGIAVQTKFELWIEFYDRKYIT